MNFEEMSEENALQAEEGVVVVKWVRFAVQQEVALDEG